MKYRLLCGDHNRCLVIWLPPGRARATPSSSLGPVGPTYPPPFGGSLDLPDCTRQDWVRAVDWRTMEQHLPKVYLAFRDAYPEVTRALDELGRSTEQAGPLDDRTQRLVKVALAVGSLAEGAVRSNVRKALDAGDTAAEITHVALLAITTC